MLRFYARSFFWDARGIRGEKIGVRDISWEGNLCLAGLKEKKIIQEFVSSSSLYRGEYKDAQVSFGLIFSPCRGRYVRERNFGELFSQTVSFLKNFVVK